MEKKYQVTIRSFTWMTYTVEAESKEHAEYLAMQKKNEGKETPDKVGANVQVEVREQEDREIKVGHFIQVTTLDGRKFIAQALYVTKEYVITTHQEQYNRSMCRVWFGCPVCGKE